MRRRVGGFDEEEGLMRRRSDEEEGLMTKWRV
jgi:hypothetical protein